MTESVRVWSRLCFKGNRGAADNQHRRRGTPQAYSCEPHVVHGLPMGICKVKGQEWGSFKSVLQFSSTT